MYSEDYVKAIEENAYKYIEECCGNTKEVATGSGKIVEIKDRHIPTIDYYLRIWLIKNGLGSIDRSTYYDWLNQEDNYKSHTIKRVDELFKTLAVDIVANEGKGIFYAKNRLDMSDRVETKNDTNVTGGLNITLNLE